MYPFHLFFLFLFLGDHLQEGHLFFGEESPHASGEVFFGKSGEDHAVQLFHIVAEKVEHAADDAVFAGMDGDADFLFRFGALHILHIIGDDNAVGEFESVANGSHIDGGEGFVQFHQVGFFNL